MSVELIGVGHTTFIVNMELMWVRDVSLSHIFAQVFVKISDQHIVYYLLDKSSTK